MCSLVTSKEKAFTENVLLASSQPTPAYTGVGLLYFENKRIVQKGYPRTFKERCVCLHDGGVAYREEHL